jgi:hypothetical protein
MGCREVADEFRVSVVRRDRPEACGWLVIHRGDFGFGVIWKEHRETVDFCWSKVVAQQVYQELDIPRGSNVSKREFLFGSLGG